MRRTILSTLFLFPALAYGQAGSATATKLAASPGVLMATGTPIAAPMRSTSTSARPAAFREVVHEQVTGDFLESALRDGGTLEYTMKATPVQASAPQVTHAVELDLSQQELSAQPAVSNVVVRAVVDQYGIARNVAIAQSAGAVVDQKAIAAVSQYRFKPAMFDNQPTWATVAISIKIQKQ